MVKNSTYNMTYYSISTNLKAFLLKKLIKKEPNIYGFFGTKRIIVIHDLNIISYKP